VRDAHSLYLETLAELGPIGLALVVAALCAPLLAVARARRRALAPAALGAYIAFVLHAAVDWDWVLPAVTLAALFCGASVLLAAHSRENARPLAPRVRGGAVLTAVPLAIAALVCAIGNSAMDASRDAATADRLGEAEAQARKATRWLPWSAERWRLLGEAQYAGGDLARARASFRRAIAKDPDDWNTWYAIAIASRGRPRDEALARARRLNPLSPEIAQLAPEATSPKVSP